MQKNNGGLCRRAFDSEFCIGILLGILFSVFLFFGCFHEG